MEKYGRAGQATDDNIIQRMRFVCWITKATNTHSEYAMLTAFPRQQWLRERTTVLLYTYIARLDVCLEQWYSTWGTRIPGGTRRHVRGTVKFKKIRYKTSSIISLTGRNHSN